MADPVTDDDTGDAAPPVLLAVDVRGRADALLSRLAALAGQPEQAARLVHVGSLGLTADLLARLLPDAVIVPLFGPWSDALDLAERLQALGYRGALLVLAPPLPDRALVLRELTGAAPGLQVRLLMPD